MYTLQDMTSYVYKESVSTDASETPSEQLPPLLDRVYALDEIIQVDAYIPGCPTAPELIAQAVTGLLEGKPFTMPERSVCDECPTKREKKASGGTINRTLTPLEVKVGEPWENTRCYMEQGWLCLGPVTKAGCAQSMLEEGEQTVPRCIKGHMPCRGCFGPIRKGANPMVEMMGALSSIGLDPKQVPDRRAMMNRYIGGQNRLRPLPARPGMP
jgi:F420-non-reducing hydrogenase small subunit